MHSPNENRDLTVCELTQMSREKTKPELTEQELSNVSGGFFRNCCAGAHYDKVMLVC